MYTYRLYDYYYDPSKDRFEELIVSGEFFDGISSYNPGTDNVSAELSLPESAIVEGLESAMPTDLRMILQSPDENWDFKEKWVKLLVLLSRRGKVGLCCRCRSS